MIVHDVIQGSPEWFALRCGHFTASNSYRAMAVLKNGQPAASRADLRLQLAVERLTGEVEDTYTSPDMARGIEQEPFARAAYEAATGNLVTTVGYGYCEQGYTEYAGCSPDGLVGDDGLIEIKCPKAKTHLGYWQTRTVPIEYKYQILHQLWVTGRAWCDWVSYHGRMPEPLRLLVIRVPRVEEDIGYYALAARQFLREVEAEVDALTALMGETHAAV